MAHAIADAVEFTDCQRRALAKLQRFASAPDKPLFVLAGPAGSGKTFLMRHFLAEASMEATHVVVKLAPTHKAKKVLQQSLPEGRDAATIASFFQLTGVVHPDTLQEEYRVPGKWHAVCCRTGAELHDLDDRPRRSYRWEYVEALSPVSKVTAEARKTRRKLLFVVDEVSMVCLADYERLLAAFRTTFAALPGSKAVLLGDDAQLPPVKEASTMFFTAAFLQRPDVLKFQMREIVRTRDAQLKANLTYVRGCIDGRVGADLRTLEAGPNVVVCEDLAEHFAEFQAPGRSVRVLAFRNETVVGYNMDVKARLSGERTDEAGPGDVVMFTQQYVNPTGARANNSDTARVVAVDRVQQPLGAPGGRSFDLVRYTLEDVDGAILPAGAADRRFLVYQFADGGAYVREQASLKGRIGAEHNVARRQDMIDGDLRQLRSHNASFRLCFAQTVHKSQGETIDVVLLDGDDVMRCGDTATRNRLLYTAMSRARLKLVIKRRHAARDRTWPLANAAVGAGAALLRPQAA